MNHVKLSGWLVDHPRFYCTEQGLDLTRLTLETATGSTASCVHHCLAYGPAAIDLHTHLLRGNRLAIEGALIYRGRPGAKRPVILIRGYSYLDALCPSACAVGRTY